MGIELDDILGFNFFQYGSPYIGECGGMHFSVYADTNIAEFV